MDKKEIIERLNHIYNNKYDYSQIGEIKNTNSKIKIICNKHGAFYKTVNNHLRGQGCTLCKQEEIIAEGKKNLIEKGNLIHSNKYDYSKVEYINNHTKVCIICPIHGEFWQAPSSHLNGCGCPKCANKNKTLEEIISKCKKIHGDKYDYSLITTPNMSIPQKIRCKNCGAILNMTLSLHIHNKIGCKYCNHRSYAYSKEEFIKKAKEVHGDKYDYSKVEYINSKTKICIICPIHGEFWQTPDKHIRGQGCPKCSGRMRKDTEQFIEEAKKVHGDRFIYDKVEYKNTEKKVTITCPIHGDFEQTPHSHLSGVGCPKCHEEKHINETALYEFLNSKLKCEVLFQYKSDWLKAQSLDIYIPSKKIGIEYQGIQHFTPVNYFGGKEKYEYTILKDKEKYEKCKKNGVKLFYFSLEKNLPNSYLDTIYSNNEILLKEILNYDNN